MTISNENYLKQVTLTSANQAIATQIKIQDSSHVTVTRTRSNVVTALVLDTDYSVTNVNVEAGCTVTTISQAVGDFITIRRGIPLTQTSDYENNTEFPPETVEENLDKLTQLIQQVNERVDRCVRIPVDDSGDKGQLLASATTRAGQDWSFDGNGVIVLGGDGGGGAGAPFGRSLEANVTAFSSVNADDIDIPDDAEAIIEVLVAVDGYGYIAERRFACTNQSGTLTIENGMLQVYNNNAIGSDTCNPSVIVNSNQARVVMDGSGLNVNRDCTLRWTCYPLTKTAIPYTTLTS